MKITIAVSPQGTVANARGVFKRGDQVDWPAKDAQPLVDSGSAVEGWVELEGEADPVDEEDEAGMTAVQHAKQRGHPLTQFAWGSDEALELALAESLGPGDFEGVEPSGSSGYIVDDVRGILSAD